MYPASEAVGKNLRLNPRKFGLGESLLVRHRLVLGQTRLLAPASNWHPTQSAYVASISHHSL